MQSVQVWGDRFERYARRHRAARAPGISGTAANAMPPPGALRQQKFLSNGLGGLVGVQAAENSREAIFDAKTATSQNSIGDAELKAVWTDPDFDASANAFYYVSVLEIPTPRWSTSDAVRGADLTADIPASVQQRCWSSLIRSVSNQITQVTIN